MSPQVKLSHIIEKHFVHIPRVSFLNYLHLSIFLKNQGIFSWKISICLCKFSPLNLTALKDVCSLF